MIERVCLGVAVFHGGSDGGDPAVDDAGKAVGDEGAQVVLVGVPPADDDTGQLEAVEQPDRLEFSDEALQQGPADIHQRLRSWQVSHEGCVLIPPAVQGGVQFGFAGLDAFVCDDPYFQVCLEMPWREVQVGIVAGGERSVR